MDGLKAFFTPLLVLIPPIEYHDDTGENDDRDNVKECNDWRRPPGSINFEEGGERTGNDGRHYGDADCETDKENRKFGGRDGIIVVSHAARGSHHVVLESIGFCGHFCLEFLNITHFF